MKKFFLLLAIILTISAFQLKGQTPSDCMGNCPEPWIEANVISTNIGMCQLKIYYSCREACKETLRQIRIDNVEYSGDCSMYDERDILDIAALAAIEDNHCDFPVPTVPEDCLTDYRVTFRACWRFYPQAIPPRLSPCASSNYGLNDCCYTSYKICIDRLGRKIISIEDEGQPLPDCGLTDPPGCQAVCD